MMKVRDFSSLLGSESKMGFLLLAERSGTIPSNYFDANTVDRIGEVP
jgi:hypothetical protein